MRSASFFVYTALAIIALQSCSDKKMQFTELSSGYTGINFRNILYEDNNLNIVNYLYFYNGGGVSVGDINNDGLSDILFTGNMVKNRLYQNKGNFKFEDITAKSGVAEIQGWCTGASMVDINNDGLLDIYLCRSVDANPEKRANLLFINQGNLSFKESAKEYGLADNGFATQASFFDYDKDGDLDCFIINHSLQEYTGEQQDNVKLRSTYNENFANKLYRNDNGHFSDVSKEAGITSNVLTFGLGISVSDFNNDGWPDVYTSNDFNEPDYYYLNNKDGTFKESLKDGFDLVSLFSMGTDAADYNNDGLIDIVTLDMLPEDNYTQKTHSGAENFDKFHLLFDKGFYYQYSRNMLQKNNGDGTFSEVGQLAGISNTNWSWSSLFADFDNDGYKDLFVSNGYVKDLTDMDFIVYSINRQLRAKNGESYDPMEEYLKKIPTIVGANYLFKNNGDETFTNRAREWGLDKISVSAGAAYADLDNDGDLDLVVNNSNDVATVYRNNSETLTKNNYLRIQLKGSSRNKNGIGAKVKVYAGQHLYYQEQMPIRGYQSSVDLTLVFGAGNASKADSIIIMWPDGKTERLNDVPTNTSIVVDHKHAKSIADNKPPIDDPIFTTDTLSAVVHKENVFKDFTIQSLLPHYLSRQGPCIAVGDVNNDGKEDYVIGGAHNQPAQLFIQSSKGKYFKKTVRAFLTDSAYEDVAAAFFDADNDGDMDLFMCSGGYEFGLNDPLYQDRLYVNEGLGKFIRKDNSLPKMLSSSGCVAPSDIDEDGDIDLFIGGRVVPASYPEAPRSYILLNNGKGSFNDETDSVCAGLKQPGMITDAVWADLNNDRQPDLVVAGEWMPIKVFINNKGKLSDASSTYIHFPSNGWWNRIEASDMDMDGDTDLIVGNCGLNTQFHVSEKKPMTVHYKDFDSNGSIDPILSYYINDTSYFSNSRDDLAEQLPLVKKKYIVYRDFAKATINDLFSADQLRDAKLLKAETMQTVYLENQGNNGFAMHPLPSQAQYSPVYGIVTADFNDDGKKDILLAGNNKWTRIKFSQYSSNHGVLLSGDGKGTFTYIPQTKSGLKLRCDVKCLELIKSGNELNVFAGVNNGNALMLKINK
jgi:enediyne biosynthesis protein E4